MSRERQNLINYLKRVPELCVVCGERPSSDLSGYRDQCLECDARSRKSHRCGACEVCGYD